jgi:glycosyltransferase involved in cell wall biosynthesis
MISIVTGYYNRLDLFLNTLRTISKSEVKDIEVIAVDDGSSEEHRLEDLIEVFPFLKVIRVEPEDKWWVNPCVTFNKGFKEANGDIIVIQNPECKHMGDVLTEASKIKEGEYISFACYSIDEDTTYGKNLIINNRPASHDGDNAWYNHSVFRPVGYHFCAVITKKDLDELGGFDERYAYGIGYDDNEFLHRVKKKLNFRIVDNPFVIHQWHKSVNYSHLDTNNLLEKNRNLLNGVTLKENTWQVNRL